MTISVLSILVENLYRQFFPMKTFSLELRVRTVHCIGTNFGVYRSKPSKGEYSINVKIFVGMMKANAKAKALIFCFFVSKKLYTTTETL